MSEATILDAMTDPALFGRTFGGDSWAAWRALLGGFYGVETDAGTFCALTGREPTSAPVEGFTELWLAMGRRGGKSHAAALLAVFEGFFRDHRAKLSPGEVATVMVIASDRRQARTVMRYIVGLVDGNPMLGRMVANETAEGLELTNRTVIEVATATHRGVRGYTIAAAILDEIAFWHSDGANPDQEIVAALRPALATLGGKLVALSSPYAKRGVLWATYSKHYGGDGRVLVAQAPSRVMNPSLPQSVVYDAMADDPAAARAEWLAEFRGDIATFLDPEMIAAATRPWPLEIPPSERHRYFAFVDPSGGGPDEFSLAIGHVEPDGSVVVDCLRGRRGSPAEVVREYVSVLRGYGVWTVTGDRYAGAWPADEFRRHGVRYQPAGKDRSGLYIELLAALNSGRVQLPPDPKLGRQLAALERRTGSSGRDIVDHPPSGHDDLANAVAGLCAEIKQPNAHPRQARIRGLV